MKKSRILWIVVSLLLIGTVLILGFLELTSPSGNNGGSNNPGDNGGSNIPGDNGGSDNGSPVPEDGSSYLSISHRLYCATDEEDVKFSKNPPYFVGEKYYFWVEITVCAKANVSDVVVSDSFEAELMVEGVSYVPIERPGPYLYTFDYAAGYEPGADVGVGNGTYVWSGSLDEDGVVFGEFAFGWSGDSLEVAFEWNVGSMVEGDVKVIYVTVSTDVNPGGLQEFAVDGVHVLDSGASVVGVVESTSKLVGVESSSIEIMVYEKVE